MAIDQNLIFKTAIQATRECRSSGPYSEDKAISLAAFAGSTYDSKPMKHSIKNPRGIHLRGQTGSKPASQSRFYSS